MQILGNHIKHLEKFPDYIFVKPEILENFVGRNFRKWPAGTALKKNSGGGCRQDNMFWQDYRIVHNCQQRSVSPEGPTLVGGTGKISK